MDLQTFTSRYFRVHFYVLSFNRSVFSKLESIGMVTMMSRSRAEYLILNVKGVVASENN